MGCMQDFPEDLSQVPWAELSGKVMLAVIYSDGTAGALAPVIDAGGRWRLDIPEGVAEVAISGRVEAGQTLTGRFEISGLQ